MYHPLILKRVLWHALFCMLLLGACRSGERKIQPDAAFTPYIPAFTAGRISARAPILVRVAEDQRWRDTSETAIQKLFDLEPKVQGTVRWHDERTLAFQPNERLRQEQTYTVTFHLGRLIEVSEGLKEFRFQVTTIAQNIDVRVDEMASLSPNDLTWQRLIVSVYTSDDATDQDLEGCFTTTQGQRTLQHHWEHEGNGNHHRFVVDSVLRGEEASEVLISWNGERIGTKDRSEVRVEIPSINTLTLVSAQTITTDEQHAILHFSDPLDPTQDLTGLVGIAGAQDVRLTIQGNRLLMYPATRLSGDQQGYISSALRNVNGRRLDRDVTIDLRFEDLKPAVRMVGDGAILPSSDGLVLPFEAVNLNAVEVRVVKIHESNVTQFLQVNKLSGERELARVGRLVTRRTIPLRTADNPDPGRWNRYFLDLEQHFKTEPGAIYRVELSFNHQHSTYPCDGTSANSMDISANERSWEDEQAEYDQVQDQWYYDYYDHYEEEYDWQQREDPCSPSYYMDRTRVTRNLLASDLGLIAKRGNDGSLLVAVSDLRTTEPLSGVKVDVLDMQRKTMSQAVTDREGLITLPPTPHRPFMLLASKGAQRGYLKMDDGSSLSISEFDVKGEAIDRGLKGFIYGERGVWRPGDSLYVTFILQDAQKKLPKDHPVVLELSDPRGRLDQKHVRTNGNNGMYAFRMATSPDAPTGMWNAQITVGSTRFHKAIRIETVKPNRLKVLLDISEKLTAESGRNVKLRSTWLHGAPARELKTRVTITMTPASPQFKGYEKYRFNDLRNYISGDEQVVFDGKLDAGGEAVFPLMLDLGNTAPAVVNTNIVTRVFEAGGDASMDRVSVPFYPYTSYAGIRPADPQSAWGNYVTDTTYHFNAVAVNENGKPIAGRTLKAQVYKLNHHWWYEGNMDGPANYISSPSVELKQEQTIITDGNGNAIIKFRIDRPEWGSFAVRLSDPESGHASAVQVHVDWPGYEGRAQRGNAEQASMLTFNTDKDKYRVGEEATLVIPSSGSGRALVSIENGSRVLDAEWVDLMEKETRHTFTITADMAPNVYAHVTLVQPHAHTLNDLPIRLYGVIPVFVEDASTHLYPKIAMAREIRTDVPFEVEVSEANGEPMTYTLAIVDEGLLDLTRFKTPDPWNHFYAREALGVRTWDMYDDVIGAFARQLHRLLALGGSDEVRPGDAARANRFKPVVRYVGPFTLQRGKKAKHDFTIGNYVGSVRVMVVASNGERGYGNAEQVVPVKKPLMVLATMPRVLAPGELADLPVTVFAMDPKLKDVQVRIEPNELLVPEGPAQKTITFRGPGDQVVSFKVRVKDAVGVARLKVSAESAGESATERIELQVRQPNLPITEVAEKVIEGSQSWEYTPVPVGIGGTNSAYLEISSIPPVDMGRRLQYLLGYPHGCLEQTTSKAFPQLFVSRVMEMPEKAAHMARANVEAALGKLVRFQRIEGGFNYWPGGDHYDTWTSIYAGHFMIEADRMGYTIPGQVKSNWLNFQRKLARDWKNGSMRDGWDRRQDQLTQAYRLYVLALAKSNEVGAMNRLREQKDMDLGTRWVLAAAYAHIGRTDAARELAKGLDTQVMPYTEQAYTYGSDLRDEALIADALLAMGEMEKAALVVQRISRRLSSEAQYSTQSTAFGLLAVARLAEQSSLGRGMDFMITLNGKSEDRHSDKALVRVDLPAPDGRTPVKIANKGKGILYSRVVRTGTPLAGEETGTQSGMRITVDYQLINGTSIDPARIEQGTDLVALVSIQHPGSVNDAYHNLALTQIFPSGWEIRNARVEGTEHQQRESHYTYRDIRDDRVMTYCDLGRGQTHTYKIMLNAAYTGRYYLPGAHCEAMYDHTVNARSKGRWVEVVPAGGTKVAAVQ